MRLPYKEGTWFAIPLRHGGFATARVARLVPHQGKIILTYIFGPKRDTIPSLAGLDMLSPKSAIKVARVGDLGLIDGSWPIIGDAVGFERDEWTIPTFIRRDDIAKVAWLVVYADDNPNEVVSEQSIPYQTEGLEKDSLLGAGAAELVISQLLSAH